MTSLFRLLALLLVATAAAGCATPVYENSMPWADGWRLGKVSRIETTADDLAFYKRQCTADQLGVERARFAVVQWREVSRQRWTIARIPPDVTLVAGEPVYVKVWDCSTALVKRDRS